MLDILESKAKREAEQGTGADDGDNACCQNPFLNFTCAGATKDT